MEIGGGERPGQKAFQKFVAGLPGGDVKANAPTPLSPEQQYYRELLGGFFAKITRWQALLAADQFLQEDKRNLLELRSFDVVVTPSGSIIVPPRKIDKFSPLEAQPDIVLRLNGIVDADSPDVNSYAKRFTVSSGQAGKTALVDRNGNPLEYVEIVISKAGLTKESSSQWFKILADIGDTGQDPEVGMYDRMRLDFEELRGKLTIEKQHYPPRMPNAYASHLFTTIDTLIPHIGGGTPAPQSSEKPAPTLPAPGTIRNG